MSPDNMDLSGTDLDGFLGIEAENTDQFAQQIEEEVGNFSGVELTSEQSAAASYGQSRPIWERPMSEEDESEDEGGDLGALLPGASAPLVESMAEQAQGILDEREKRRVLDQAEALAQARQQQRSYFRPTSWRPVDSGSPPQEAQVVGEGDETQDAGEQSAGAIGIDSDGEVTYEIDGEAVNGADLYVDESGNLYTMDADSVGETTQAVVEGAAKGLWESIPAWIKVVLGLVLVKKALS